MIRLVSFLGLGARRGEFPFYTPCRYSLDGKIQADPTALVQDAISQLAEPKIESWTLFVTEEVSKRWLETDSLIKACAPRSYECHPVLLPVGETPAERWTIFEKVRSALTAPPAEGIAGEEEEGEVWLDVTHGFRSHPILAMAAVQFVLAEQLQNQRETGRPNAGEPRPKLAAPRLRILYGAFDAGAGIGDDVVAPIWDLTEFVRATEWHSALSAFMRFGRADDLQALSERETREQMDQAQRRGEKGLELARYAAARRFGGSARTFADDLATARVPLLVSHSGPGLKNLTADQTTRDLVSRLPPLGGAITKLQERLDFFHPKTKLCTIEGLSAMVRLASLYGVLERFSEQSAVIREALILHFALLTSTESLPQPGSAGFNQAWETIEQRWRKAGFAGHEDPGKADPAVPASRGLESQQRNSELSRRVAEVRNSVQHAGLQTQPPAAQTIREQLDLFTKQLSKLVDDSLDLLTAPALADADHDAGSSDKQRPDEAPDQPQSGILINLSNHPISTWTQEQRAAAAVLGQPIDLEGGMPPVGPDSDTAAVSALANEIVQKALAAHPTAAAVFGETVLTSVLVARLQARGLRCYAPTTERNVEEQQSGENQVERRSTFRFRQWREYPSLAEQAKQATTPPHP